MATHTHLPIYKVAYDLLDVVTDLVKNMQRDFKRSIGEKINAECIEITVLVFRANVALASPMSSGIEDTPSASTYRKHTAQCLRSHRTESWPTRLGR